MNGLKDALGDASADEGGRGGGGGEGDEDDMEFGGAWWHVGGIGSGHMPVHVAGAEFRPGAGLVVRFRGVPAVGTGTGADSSSSASASSQSHAATATAAAAAAAAFAASYSPAAVVPAVWVSSAVLKVEPPAAVEPPATAHASWYPEDVPLEVSVNGGVSYSTEVLQYRVEIPV